MNKHYDYEHQLSHRRNKIRQLKEQIKLIASILAIVFTLAVWLPMTVGVSKVAINFAKRVDAIEDLRYSIDNEPDERLKELTKERLDMYDSTRGMYFPYALMFDIKVPGVIRGLIWITITVLPILWFVRKWVITGFSRFKGWMQKTWERFLAWLGIEVVDIDDDDDD